MPRPPGARWCWAWRCCRRWRWSRAAYATVLLTDIAIAALFAASLHCILGPGGLYSFGHAAYFPRKAPRRGAAGAGLDGPKGHGALLVAGAAGGWRPVLAGLRGARRA
ncbi:MAG: hypothetical protein U1E74_06525 [Paenacidovorax caeni]